MLVIYEKINDFPIDLIHQRNMDSNDEYAFGTDDEESDFICDDISDLYDDFIELDLESESSTVKEQQETECFKYEVLTADQILQFMADSIKEVNATAQPITRSVVSTSSDNITCEICLDSRNVNEMSGLECGHKFCLECWCEYLTSKIIDEGMGQTISCAAYDCDILVDDVTVMKLITNPKVKLKYQQILRNSFVECNRLLRWCPAPECGHAVKVSHYDTKPVTCKCGYTFCFACGENWHYPVKCFWLNKWIKKCDDDSEVSNWIAANVKSNRLLYWCKKPDCKHAVKVADYDTKPVSSKCGHTFCLACGENWHHPDKLVWLRKWRMISDDELKTYDWIAANTKECPKCHVAIERDGGCNHMICEHQNCKTEFCWACLGPWTNHVLQGNNCNNYIQNAARQVRDPEERSRVALQRYRFYWSKYVNHKQSLDFESKLNEPVRRKMEEIHNRYWIDTELLKKAMMNAVDVLCSCRKTLMYNYVFAFYLKINNQSILFEYQQKELENATEQLSAHLNMVISSKALIDNKQKIENKTRDCELRRNVLLEHAHEGYREEYWKYQEDL
ncbi:hypothetical protein CHS0354_013833 [Potamilus streckersoni]|uniref:RBR-type E3 ubiquitin transferase n=1 Tax=Potamilus streckersoni TaxID=2493646 RepID=A0AAE0T766_9BIVA|nr:hypothetical protein CHS0354_013833 [Potamilus streckersoni]